MKTDITKAFRCPQAVSMGEFGQKQSMNIMDCSLCSLSDFEVDVDTVQETTDDDVLNQILLQVAPQRVQIKYSHGVGLWHVTIYLKNCHTCKQCSKKRKNIIPGGVSVSIGPGINFWIYTSLLMTSDHFTLLFSSYLSVF